MRERDRERELISWCFEPSQPQRITSGRETERERQTKGKLRMCVCVCALACVCVGARARVCVCMNSGRDLKPIDVRNACERL